MSYLENARLEDGDRFFRNVVESSFPDGLDALNSVHDIHSLDHSPEHGIPVRVRILPQMVQGIVVDRIYEKLRRGGVENIRPRHRHRPAIVLQAVVRFALYRRDDS